MLRWALAHRNKGKADEQLLLPNAPMDPDSSVPDKIAWCLAAVSSRQLRVEQIVEATNLPRLDVLNGLNRYLSRRFNKLSSDYKNALWGLMPAK